MIGRLYELALGRPPRSEELRATLAFLRDQTEIIRQRLARGETVAQLKALPGAVDAAVAWADLCLAALNLNEFVYVR
jgi:hypothetical protein